METVSIPQHSNNNSLVKSTKRIEKKKRTNDWIFFTYN